MEKILKGTQEARKIMESAQNLQVFNIIITKLLEYKQMKCI